MHVSYHTFHHFCKLIPHPPLLIGILAEMAHCWLMPGQQPVLWITLCCGISSGWSWSFIHSSFLCQPQLNLLSWLAAASQWSKIFPLLNLAQLTGASASLAYQRHSLLWLGSQLHSYMHPWPLEDCQNPSCGFHQVENKHKPCPFWALLGNLKNSTRVKQDFFIWWWEAVGVPQMAWHRAECMRTIMHTPVM